MGPSKGSRAAKAASVAQGSLPVSTLIIDNGGYTMKAGYSSANSQSDPLAPCLVIPNALAKTRDKKIYTGTQLNTHISDWNEVDFRRPVDKGYIVSWEAQRELWEHTFFDPKTSKKSAVHCPDPIDTTLILTEAPNALGVFQKNADEMVMEEWGFGGYVRYIGPCLNAWNDVHPLFGDPASTIPSSPAQAVECLLVVDSGYSSTTVTPVYHGRPLQRGIRRLDLGGKQLTNYLKELVSIRQYNMLDETYIINDAKESACYVSQDFHSDMDRTWQGNKLRDTDSNNRIVVDYVLPDPNAHKKGFVRPHDSMSAAKKKKGLLASTSPSVAEDVLVLGNERFTVPEILFSPQDIGLQQPGIPEIIMQSLSVLPTGLHPSFLANILVVGGNSLLPGFVERLESEVRRLASSECVVRVKRGSDPIRSTWLGASRMASNRETLKEIAVTRQQYEEYGSAWIGRKFSSG
ncbi:Actin- protein 6 [Myotisia sp. PD_48]|nr:Actin- protein 6 [Myotisia sp. PD_48]